MNKINNFYIKILESSIDPIVVINRNGEVVFWNNAAENLFGYKKEEIMGKEVHLLLCIHSDYIKAKKAFEKFKEAVISSLDKKTVEVKGIDKQGRVLELEISISSFKYRGETYFTGIIRLKKNAKISLKYSETVIEQILETIPVPIFIKDDQLKYTYVNKAFEEFTGISKAQAKGKTVFELYPFDLANIYNKQDLKILDKPQNQVYSFKVKNIKGELREVEFHKSSFADESGKVIGILGVYFDIQEKNELLRELESKKLKLEEALAAKTRFLSYMGHELRTPLNNIIGFASILKNTSLSSQQREYLENIIIASHNLLNILSNILELSKLEFKDFQINPKKTNLPNLILSVVDMVKFECYLKGLEFHLFISPLLPEQGIVDDLRLRQVLLNLLSNAIKYTSKGYVELSAVCEKLPIHPNKTKVTFTVNDTGRGMSEEDIKVIFEPFKRAERTKDLKGTGLGLPITKKILELMGSEIKVKSELGKGSTFNFTLYLEVVSDTSEQYFGIFSGKNILLILNLDKRFITLMNYLLYWGFEPIITSTQEEISLLISENKKFDFLIIDRDLTFMDLSTVLSLIEKLKKEGKLSYAIMLFKPVEEVENILKITGNIIDTFMQKPINPLRLLDLFKKPLQPEEHEKSEITTRYSKLSKKLKILIVDDVQTNIKLLRHLLNQKISGLDIIEARDGEEAILLYENQSPDIIFMDLQMPIMNGFEALNIIRKKEKTKEKIPIPIIALTANYEEEEKKRALIEGFNDYLTKPIILSELESILEKYLFSGSITEDLVKKDIHEDKMRIDYDYFRQNSLDREFISNLFQLSLKTIPQYIEELRLNYKEGDLENLKKSAHKLKGAASSAGFKRLTHLAEYINKADLSNMSKEELEGKIKEIDEEWDLLKEEIRGYLDNKEAQAS